MKERAKFDPGRRRLLKLLGVAAVDFVLEGCQRSISRVQSTPTLLEAYPIPTTLEHLSLESRETKAEKEFCLILPLDGMPTQRFGDRHKGIDIGASEGTPVLAAADGEIWGAWSGWKNPEKGPRYVAEFRKVKEDSRVRTVHWGINPRAAGNYVAIYHDEGVITIYCHLKEVTVKEESEVLAGEQIGEVGVTGHTTGAHLHFEVIKDGENVDPMLYLDVKCERE